MNWNRDTQLLIWESSVDKADLKLAVKPGMTLNFWLSYLHIPEL